MGHLVTRARRTGPSLGSVRPQPADMNERNSVQGVLEPNTFFLILSVLFLNFFFKFVIIIFRNTEMLLDGPRLTDPLAFYLELITFGQR